MLALPPRSLPLPLLIVALPLFPLVFAIPNATGLSRLAVEELEAARAGQATASLDIDDKFWEALGGKGHINKRTPVDVKDAPPSPDSILGGQGGVLYKLNEASSGSLRLDEVTRGALDLSMLVQSDVYLCDPGTEIIVWVGEGASDRERRAAMLTATKYLALYGKPNTYAARTPTLPRAPAPCPIPYARRPMPNMPYVHVPCPIYTFHAQCPMYTFHALCPMYTFHALCTRSMPNAQCARAPSGDCR